MVPALILVLAAWCPITTTTTTSPPATTSTGPSTTSTSRPALIIEPPHLEPPGPPTATTAAPTTTTAPAKVDSAVATRPPKRLPYTGMRGDQLVVGGTLVFLGGLFVAAGRPDRSGSRRN